MTILKDSAENSLHFTPVGIDPSLTSLGFCTDGIAHVFQSKKDGPERLIEIRDHVKSNLTQLRNPIVAIEGYSFGSKNSQSHKIGELGGVLRVELYELEIPFIEVPPTVLKKFLTGKGIASKGDVMSAVSARTQIVWSGSGSDDKCDSWGLEELIHVHYGRNRWDWPKANIETLDKLDWVQLDDWAKLGLELNS